MLGDGAILAIIQDAALLASLAVLYDLSVAERPEGMRTSLVTGLGLGVLALAACFGPHPTGLSFDPVTATIVFAMAGLFFGAISAGIAALITVVGMAILGVPTVGQGLVVAAGLGTGLVLNDRWSGRLGRLQTRELLGVGLVLALVVAARAAVEPGTAAGGEPVLDAVWILVMVPIATTLIGSLLSYRVHRAEARRSLSIDEERLRLAMTGSGQGLFDYDLSSGRGGVSRDFIELLEEDPATYRTDLDGGLARIHPDDLPDVRATLDRIERSETDEMRVEYRARTRTGRYVWVRSVGRVITRLPDGHPSRLVGTNQDITAMRVAEIRAQGITAENQRLLDEAVASRRALLSLVEDLRATQQTQQATLDRYMGLVQHSPDAILVNREDRMVLANDAALRLLGASAASQVLGRTPYEIFAPEVHEVVRQRIRELRAHGTPAPVRELKVVRLDGEVVEVEAAASPFDDSGVTAIHIVLRDITDRKRAEAALVALNAELEERVRTRTADLEAAYRELESFSYSVSHDLRAPLRAITGFSQILRRRNLEQLDETGRHYLDNISTAGERMGALIEDLLAYSRVGRRDVRREPLDVGAIADAVAATLAPRIIETGASLGVEPPICVPLGDPTLFQQVLLNLMGNGLTYSRLDVPPDITVRSIRRGEHVEVSVEDNGIGISPEHHERVFEVFTRLHTEDEIPGTGIGLAIVRKAARLMDGDVSVRSEPGAGSTFTLRLPAAPDDASPTPIDLPAVGLPTHPSEEHA